MRPGEAMGKPSHNLALSVAVLVGLSSARATTTADDALPIVVLVDNRASAAAEVIDQAGKEVARIHRQAGLRVLWLAKSQAPHDSAGTFTVYLMVRTGLLPKGNTPSEFLMGAAPGGALDCGGVVYLFFDQVIEFARVHQTGAALVMGTVVAHEIGHLLLGNRGHTSEGLMRASWSADDWQRASAGFLLFSRRESELMRATISSCR
jgi:hypothetical protein